MCIISREKILYESKTTGCFVVKSTIHKGYDVLKNSTTHSFTIGIIAWEGERGLRRAIQLCDNPPKAFSGGGKGGEK